MATQASLPVQKRDITSESSIDPVSMTLDRLPIEILLIIATLMTDNTINTPVLSGGISYTSSEGIIKQYSSFDSHAFGNSGVLEATAYDKVVKDSQRDILSLALTNRRIFTACENAMFRTIVVCAQGFNFRGLLDIFVKKPELQRCVEHLSARNTWPGIVAQTNHAEFMHRTLNTDLLSCSLRSVDLKRLTMTTDFNSNVLKQWCLLLPKLRRLERLSMTRRRFFTEEFPYLPNVQEAYFISCCYGFVTREVFPKLPSLRVLANHGTFEICPENMLQPFEDTLESLSWGCGLGEDLTAFATALCRLKNLKHLQTECFDYMFAGEAYIRSLFVQDPCRLPRTLETVEFFPHSWGEILRDPTRPVSERTKALESLLRLVEGICRSMYPGMRVVDLRYLFGQKERGGRPKGCGPDLVEWWGTETSVDLSREELQRRSGITFIYE
ncbi:hypothetical protein CkaCkLH20_10458 [Colletotrichum karsti]|uniref:Uncharacterized protein n=1 Tax=Colletotrichum karsti TaxID=1095194 RepID=A0A9P6I155_9PEZI|nr:uncharacterized protein CkaCkLH20_10458 [Colletotrichum karsti]KAF9872121.1 hypothetical protein CkaCkLH20_10458 [Colletotrichum karsti]